MKRFIAGALTFGLIAAVVLPASAQQHRGNTTQRQAPPARSAPAPARPAQPARPAPQPAQRPAPALRPAPAAAPPTRGFDLNRDINPPRQVTPQPVTRRVSPQPAPNQSRGNGGNNTVAHNPVHNQNPRGHRISNPQYANQSSWGWNRGVVWSPAPTYWGGGFWGPFAFDLIAAAFGTYSSDNQDYDSYQVLPDSPGATLLANYQLTQTPCGQPNLVIIWGPDNSVICAYPNNLVGPGEYDVDPTTLSLVSDTD